MKYTKKNSLDPKKYTKKNSLDPKYKSIRNQEINEIE